MNPLQQAKQLGQSIWLDNLSRTLIQEGGLARLIAEDGVSGVTSNPAIFFNAISKSPYYRDDVARLKAAGVSGEPLYEALVIPDIQAACDLMRPEYGRSARRDGYVSLEVSPALAHDSAGTVAAGLRLKAAVDRPNLLIKVPATAAGLTAIEELIAQGCSVNVTLMFSLAHVDAVARAYTKGLQRLVAGGGDPRPVKSVASLFLSRVDTLVDKRLEASANAGHPSHLGLRGRAALALARLAYQAYHRNFATGDFLSLATDGAHPQFMLWASTGTKNAAYSDVLYLDNLIGPDTVNTVPDATLAAFRDHGRAAVTLDAGTAEAEAHFTALAEAGVDMQAVGTQLQDEGVKLFEQAFDDLLRLLA